MIAETLIILFVIAVKQKSFENLASIPTRAYGFLIGFVAIKIAVFLCAKMGADLDTLRFVSFFSHALLFAFLYYNRNYKGVYLILLGSVLNFFVMYLNGLCMPIHAEFFKRISPVVYEQTLSGKSLHHVIMTDATKFGFLGDVIPFFKPYPFAKLVSIGDIILAIGFVILGYTVLRGDYVDEEN